MNRRRFLIGAALTAASPAQLLPAFADGRTISLDGREHALTDIIAPSAAPLVGGAEPASDYALAALSEIIARGAPVSTKNENEDRWGRLSGPLRWRTASGRETTLQEILLAQGAARVAPQSSDFAFLERCFRAEKAARDGGVGLWTNDAYQIRDAAKGDMASGFQIYRGAVRKAAEHQGRVYFNFGDDFRKDFTATVRKGSFRRWKTKLDLASVTGALVEIRGRVERINGPSIELLHEMQLRRL